MGLGLGSSLKATFSKIVMAKPSNLVYNTCLMIYDLFQQKAIDYLKDGYSVIVAAPTGAGKTVIAEHIIRDCLAKDQGVIYTAPIKALSNQKFRDFQKDYTDSIGILTGDVSINTHAPVLIMTTEIFRNKVLEKRDDMKRYSWIIFDEIHYLDDYQRGSVWEESLILLPTHMKMLGLSATIPNIKQLRDWIERIHKVPIKIVREETRPVPLHFFYQCQGKIVEDIAEVKKMSLPLKTNRPEALIEHIWRNNRLPCIYFAFGRRRCEYLARDIRHYDFLRPDEKSEIRKHFNMLCEKFNLAGEKSAEILRPLIERGIAYHHAGMLPTLKEVVERLFTGRLIKVIFTTETFALGINMPARTVAFDDLRKFYGRFHSNLKTRDFYQMAGRSGRRGIDKEGFVYSRINPRFISFEELERIVYGKPEKVYSQFNTSYATILNLYLTYGEKLYDIYPLSFHYFQQKSFIRKGAQDLLRAKVRILKKLGYIEDGLSEKGLFASKIYGYELSLGELYKRDILEHLSEIELGILCAALVFEPRKASRKPPFSAKSKRLKQITGRVVKKIRGVEKNLRIRPLSKEYFFHLAPCIEAWMRGESFDRLFRYTDADEGEVIRYFRMTIQILREITETPVAQEVKERAKNTIRLINRDIIDAEKQLRL